MSDKPTIIVADDDMTIRIVVAEALRQEGWQIAEAADLPELKSLLEDGIGDVVVTDVLMPGGNGLEALPEMIEARPDLPFIVMSAHNTLSTAMAATERGAFDYLPKPFDLDELTGLIKKALESGKNTQYSTLDVDEDNILIGRSPKMQAVYRTMARVAQTELTILILGESGTGKELVARALHTYSARKHNPFVPVNMAAIPKELIESELFGHEKGAFTGASTRTLGRFGQARGGTLFLDEIGDMPLDAQTRLLRVLQEGEYQTVGGHASIKTDVRIVAATNKDLKRLVSEGEFREDLYFRLNVVPMMLPPLRERGDDVVTLAEYFLKKINKETSSQKSFSDSAKNIMLDYEWSGNVRELENTVQRICALYPGDQISGVMVKDEIDRSVGIQTRAEFSGQIIASESLSESVRLHLDKYFDQHEGSLPPVGIYQRIISEVERPLIEKALEVTMGNQLKASALLGLNRNTLRKKISDLEIRVPSKSDLS
ncbi:nitrogen regulation protein NR(I) [Kordiimonas sp. SCSIO 12610]|uniref:nitrogen regulation protein NR(I) n=1 Tax=Kordiimonas sp. SCSIO 12610 TaxID=2829597 RepID=UPI002109F7D0|nr:nitrogen regulation protein NR(I) [Kordiimonas sp. SCSIO 12610]UTW54014.1 nitrogen regulation protein NR(I) [Kordiimonas sp. SCSIO 12610]